MADGCSVDTYFHVISVVGLHASVTFPKSCKKWFVHCVRINVFKIYLLLNNVINKQPEKFWTVFCNKRHSIFDLVHIARVAYLSSDVSFTFINCVSMTLNIIMTFYATWMLLCWRVHMVMAACFLYSLPLDLTNSSVFSIFKLQIVLISTNWPNSFN